MTDALGDREFSTSADGTDPNLGALWWSRETQMPLISAVIATTVTTSAIPALFDRLLPMSRPNGRRMGILCGLPEDLQRAPDRIPAVRHRLRMHHSRRPTRRIRSGP
jgi:hypothetical protein